MKTVARTSTLGVTLALFVCCCDARLDGVQQRSRFAGSYAGPWTGQMGNAPHTGTWTITVGTDGKFSGTEKDDTSGTKAEVSGAINEDGDITFDLKYANGTYKVEGTVARTQKGNLKGTLIQYSGKEVVASYRIDLPIRQ
jgi:hypothetical protein